MKAALFSSVRSATFKSRRNDQLAGRARHSVRAAGYQTKAAPAQRNAFHPIKPQAWFAVCLLALMFLQSPPPLRAQVSSNTPSKKLLIVLVGDSTVNDGGGWGYGFKQFLTGDVACTNTAANGRSSKSFITEGRWANALALHGDYYLIQFGHNDEPGKGPDRETDPATTYPENLKRYVADVCAIGGKPILVTSLTRRNFDPSGSGKLVTNLMPYVDAMKKVAAEKNVPLLDLHARSVEYCEKIGPTETAKLNPIKDGKPDTTHLNAGARVIFAELVVEDLRKAVPELAQYLLTHPRPAAQTVVEQIQPEH